MDLDRELYYWEKYIGIADTTRHGFESKTMMTIFVVYSLLYAIYYQYHFTLKQVEKKKNNLAVITYSHIEVGSDTHS